MFQGQIGEIPFLSQKKLGFFPHFSPIGYFSTCPSQKLDTPTQLKITFSYTYITLGYPVKKFCLDALKITVSIISNCKMTVFNYVFWKSHEKHFNGYHGNKRYLSNFTFYDTFKDEPIPHKNFTFLSQGSYVVPGGWAYLPLWYPM